MKEIITIIPDRQESWVLRDEDIHTIGVNEGLSITDDGVTIHSAELEMVITNKLNAKMARLVGKNFRIEWCKTAISSLSHTEFVAEHRTRELLNCRIESISHKLTPTLMKVDIISKDVMAHAPRKTMLSKKYMKPKVLNRLSINAKRDFNHKIVTDALAGKRSIFNV